MCTTAAKQLNKTWILAKTRDPVEWMRWDDEIKLFDTAHDSVAKLIIQNPDPREDGMYGGINAHGVAYTSTFVRLDEVQVSYIRKPYVRLILEAKTAREAVEIIQRFNPKIGGNMFVADPQECFGIEGTPSEYYIAPVERQQVKTNHFTEHFIGLEDITPGFESWTRTHHARASELLANVGSVEDMIELLRDRQYSDKGEAICTTSAEEKCYTHSAFVFDTRAKKVWYAQGNPLEVEFEAYGFEPK